jgi:hypothetical protein
MQLCVRIDPVFRTLEEISSVRRSRKRRVYVSRQFWPAVTDKEWVAVNKSIWTQLPVVFTYNERKCNNLQENMIPFCDQPHGIVVSVSDY